MKRKKAWSLEEQGKFLLQLGKLLDKGYSLSQAIEFLEIQQPVSRKRDLQKCLSSLYSGLAFHKALEPLSFHSEALGYLFFAEQHGNLAQGLIEAGHMLNSKVRYLQRFQKALSYPLCLLCMMVLMLLFIQQTLVPQFTHLSSSFYSHRSSSSYVLLHVISILPSAFFTACLIAGIAIAGSMSMFTRLSPIARVNMWVKIPIIRVVARQYYTHLFALQLSHLLRGGLSIYESLQVFEKQRNVSFLRAEGSAMKEQLAQGDKLEHIVASRRYYEKELMLVIRHGQSNGELAKELFHYSEFVFEKMEETIEKWTDIVQPVLFSFIGLLVISMYLAILLPMFETINEL
ncbi:competence type IV pilus assembly protein ComGB [Anoxybacteroides tepidamans]|uniref:competence type IV pilus assembly protein ComGB n=1 Tax=Anoxybacteroides tepidamans TaxID=265948 RepID=UPI000487DA30|nr:competence type IV pilus assembly protein ComGB [Anoxybacillus tepidamans]